MKLESTGKSLAEENLSTQARKLYLAKIRQYTASICGIIKFYPLYRLKNNGFLLYHGYSKASIRQNVLCMLFYFQMWLQSDYD